MHCATAEAFFPLSWGVFHSSEQSFLFTPWARCRRSIDGAGIAAAWGSFLDGLLQTGVPGAVGNIEWPPYERDGRHQRMFIGNLWNRSRPLLSVANDDADAGVCAIWDSFYRLPDEAWTAALASASSPHSPAARTVSDGPAHPSWKARFPLAAIFLVSALAIAPLRWRRPVRDASKLQLW